MAPKKATKKHVSKPLPVVESDTESENEQSIRTIDDSISYRMLNIRPVFCEDHPTQIVEIMTRQNWHRLMRPQIECYPKVVLQFYANLSESDDKLTLSSIVNDQPITISTRILREFYGLSSPKSMFIPDGRISAKEWPLIESVLEYDKLKEAFTGKLPPNRMRTLASCSGFAKLLARLLQENILQIGNHKSDWSHIHAKTVYRLIKGETLDTATTIYEQIAGRLFPKTECLPFGNLICEIIALHYNLYIQLEDVGPKSYRFTPQGLALPEDDILTYPEEASTNVNRLSRHKQMCEKLLVLEQNQHQIISTLNSVVTTLNTLVSSSSTSSKTPSTRKLKKKKTAADYDDDDDDDIPLTIVLKGKTKRQ